MNTDEKITPSGLRFHVGLEYIAPDGHHLLAQLINAQGKAVGLVSMHQGRLCRSCFADSVSDHDKGLLFIWAGRRPAPGIPVFKIA